MRFNLAVALGLASVVTLFSVLPINYVEAKGIYGGNMEQTVAVFTIIAVAIGGFGILMALYTRKRWHLSRKVNHKIYEITKGALKDSRSPRSP